ncbi:MAG: carbamoyltransferase HypF [Coriobacteriia bacterium]|nr:carbamoyltransferase HypF [Coriobacteriia bacterium]
MKALRLQVTGVVQGVGFRPYIYKLAGELSLRGWVLNASDGVHICIEGSTALVDSFPQIMEARAAIDVPAAHIESVTIRSVPVNNFATFEIRPSQIDVNERTFISPDVATCTACLDELYDSENRRYHYPFTNCTDCGPRFTIIEDTPYDRPKTTMRNFALCSQCATEYEDPKDRRFHAQPNACFICGPRLQFCYSADNNDGIASNIDATDDNGNGSKDITFERTRSQAVLTEATEVLAQGKILAIKGLGGFQLACDARSERAVSRLRDRKFRWGKPLAVMFANIEQVARYVELSEHEQAILAGSVRPIVLCKRREVPDGGPDLALSVAPGLDEVGVMLPYTPLHHLLLEEFYGPLIMTSGNISGAPIVCDNATALKQLSSVADAFLMHDRPIAGRYDDSVVRIVDNQLQMIRRARGYALMPVKTTVKPVPAVATSPVSTGAQNKAADILAILAVGSEQKNTFALADSINGSDGEQSNYTFVSQHIGDLEDSETLDAFTDSIEQYQRLFKIAPQVIAHDLHPEYLSTKWAQVQEEQSASSKNPIQLIGVQHHHAHIAAAAAQHDITSPVIGIAFDGTGYGTDGTIWGGEVLIASTNTPTFERYAHLCPFALPGGAGAIKRPIRTLYALLDSYGLRDHPAALRIARRLEQHEGETMLAMVQRELNTPLTSSMGRLFDAVASLLGVADDAAFEGSPAMMLEAMSTDLNVRHTPPHYRFALRTNNAAHTDTDAKSSHSSTSSNASMHTAQVIIDPEPVIRALLDDLVAMEDSESDLTTAELSRRFHDAVVTMVGDVSTKAARQYGLDTVALSGGVFMNRLLLTGSQQILSAKGLYVVTDEQLPPNDGNISFGQLVIAQAHLSTPVNLVV